MLTPEFQGKAWADLLTSETAAKSAQHKVTNRACIYVSAGLPFDQVLDALKISRATWYRRVAELKAWEDENRAAWSRATGRPSEGTHTTELVAL